MKVSLFLILLILSSYSPQCTDTQNTEIYVNSEETTYTHIDSEKVSIIPDTVPTTNKSYEEIVSYLTDLPVYISNAQNSNYATIRVKSLDEIANEIGLQSIEYDTCYGELCYINGNVSMFVVVASRQMPSKYILEKCFNAYYNKTLSQESYPYNLPYHPIMDCGSEGIYTYVSLTFLDDNDLTDRGIIKDNSQDAYYSFVGSLYDYLENINSL